MIVTNCPLRVSLFGGSTDNPLFIERYGYGSVISFTCDLKTYVTIHEDKVGYNKHLHKYVLNYSIREEESFAKDIKNEVVRVVLEYFNIDPLTISLTSDVYSQGSGLASSSAYIISLIKAISIKNELRLTDTEICLIALELEQKFNPHCGLQDPFGCGVGGFKRIEFERNNKVRYTFLPTKIFDIYDMHLVFTGVNRNSKNVLKDVTNNIEKSRGLIQIVELAQQALYNEEYELFLQYVADSWKLKKETSNLITENVTVAEIDQILLDNPTVLAHKLCGAGNGGFYLVFSKKNCLTLSLPYIKINVSSSGVEGIKI